MAYLRMWRKRRADINELLQSDDDTAVTIDDAVTTNDREETTNDDGGSNTDDHSISVTTDGSDFDTDIGMCDSDVEILNPEPEVQVRNIGDDLREWSTRHQITNRSLNELLQILRDHGHVLPKDARTLLATPQVIDSHSKCNGQYIYYGLEGGISRVLSQNDAFRQLYAHFVTLTVAVSIMLDSDERKRAAYLDFSAELMRHFVSSCPALYGKTFTVYNVHALLHIHEDVSRFRCSINDICCFPYENYLQQIKRLVRTGQNPLAQVMLFVRAVWNENGKEMEGTIPDAWVNLAEKTLRWPKTRAKYCFDNHVAPKEDWETFPLLKVKFTSGNFLYFDTMVKQIGEVMWTIH
ncbi:hypothetical protein PO909_034109 [Leuciscus waleckii]